MAQYRYFHEGQLKEDPTTGTRCRTGQLNHQFVEQKFVGGVWIGIGDNDGVRYGDVAGAGCRFREGIRDGDYVVDVETEVAGFLLTEGDGWVNIGGASGYYGVIKDGNTVAWFNSFDLTTITKDAGTGEVSLWKDKLLSGHDLIQATATKKPLWSADGISFDGINDFMKCTVFALVKPESIYALIRIDNARDGNNIFAGNASGGGEFLFFGSTTKLLAYAGNADVVKTVPISANFRFFNILFNGASSSLQFDNEAAVTGNTGANDMGGFTLGGGWAGAQNSVITVKEFIIRNKVDSTKDKLTISNYLKKKLI